LLQVSLFLVKISRFSLRLKIAKKKSLLVFIKEMANS